MKGERGFKENLTIDIVMTVGFGMYTVPFMLVPSGSGVSSIENWVTLKPANLFKPMHSSQYCIFEVIKARYLSW